MTRPIRRIEPLVLPWKTPDPFLFCMHHDDAYPAGNEQMGPAASLDGRDIGQDFAGKDGWRMYHGRMVPGFPEHPHRGFETVTVVRQGLVDHSDSLGATGRYGAGDVQWMTAGNGIVHAEMFPLLERDRPNPAELFQLWLNLPAESKRVDPHFSMLWRDRVPVITRDGATITVVAGAFESARPSAPPPKSWASDPSNDVAIWTVKLVPGARWTLPPARPGTNRTLYFYRGESLTAAGEPVRVGHSLELLGEAELPLVNGPKESELLFLQGRPIGEPVVQYGPFVMNTRAQIYEAVEDYQRTQFGGWPWKDNDPVHPRTQGRFARHADGRVEQAPAG